MILDPIVFEFLRDIAANNNKEWFDANRGYYEKARAAFVSFAEGFNKLVGVVDPLVGEQDIKKCVYRINRDVRFSPDKSPYKRHFGVFVAPGGRSSRLPGYYLHVEPGASLFISGAYCLTSDELKRLRTEVANFPEELDAILREPSFVSRLKLLEDDKLKTQPRGFSVDPQYAELLKYKTFCAAAAYADDEVMAQGFAKRVEEDMRASVPLNTFFRRALESEPEEEVDF